MNHCSINLLIFRQRSCFSKVLLTLNTHKYVNMSLIYPYGWKHLMKKTLVEKFVFPPNPYLFEHKYCLWVAPIVRSGKVVLFKFLNRILNRNNKNRFIKANEFKKKAKMIQIAESSINQIYEMLRIYIAGGYIQALLWW